MDQSAAAEGLEALTPVRSPSGPVAFGLDWDSVALVWSADGYPADSAYLEYHRQSINGIRLWSVGGGPYDPEAARERAAEHADAFAAAVAARLEDFARREGRQGLVTFAIDTELLGAWWTEGPEWLRALVSAAPEHGVRLVTLSEALARHEPAERPLRDSSWGEDKDLSTWDSPAVADMAWGARRLELRLLRELAERQPQPGGGATCGARAARGPVERLGVPGLEREAGEYPFRRAVHHAEAMHQVIDSGEATDPRMRSLAPDLSLAPLLEP